MKRFGEWAEAREYALTQARSMGLDQAIRKVKEYGRVGYNVGIARSMDSDYARAEIIRPTDRI